MMTPIKVIQELTKFNKPAATVVLAGLALFAAASIVVAWQVDINTAIRVGSALLFFSVLILLISVLITNERVRHFAGIFFIFLFFATSSIFAYSAVMVDPSPFKPLPCLVRILENCEAVKDKVTQSEQQNVEVSKVSAEQVLDRKAYKVYVQFAGYGRSTMINFQTAMGEIGWHMASIRGGKRLKSAVGKSEIRYHSQAQKEAAELLAKEISETKVKEQLEVVQNSEVKADELEVWMGLE